MGFLLSGFVFGFVLPLMAIVLAARALALARKRSAATPADERIAALEEQVRGLLHRGWTLERGRVPERAGPPNVYAAESSAEADPSATAEAPAPPPRDFAAASAGVGIDAEAPAAAPPPLEPAPASPVAEVVAPAAIPSQ